MQFQFIFSQEHNYIWVQETVYQLLPIFANNGHSSSTDGLNWTWIELGFAWFGPQESGMKNPTLYTGMYRDAFKVNQ